MDRCRKVLKPVKCFRSGCRKEIPESGHIIEGLARFCSFSCWNAIRTLQDTLRDDSVHAPRINYA